MNKKYSLLFVMIVLIIVGSCYFYHRDMLFLLSNPVVEINGQFDYKEMIKEVKYGEKNDVYCDDSHLDLTQIGEYEVILVYRDKEYPVTVKVEDTLQPEIVMSEQMTVLMNTTPDLKKDVVVQDNSQQQVKLTIDASQLDMTKEGQYTVEYIAKDQTGNTTRKKRIIHVIKEYGTAIQTEEKIVYLTFDDGPSQNTKEILDILERYNAHATFFVTGNGQKYNDYIKEAYEKGHTIGLHSYCHEYNEIYCSVDAYFDDLTKVGTMVEELIGFVPHYIRFPGGSSNKVSTRYSHGIMSILTKTVIEKGYQYYDWNCSTGDAESENVPVEEIIKNATENDDNNIVLLAHDTDAKDTTVEALGSIIEYYQERGYVFKAIDDYSFYAHQKVNN